MPKNNKTLTVKVANHVAEYLEQLAKEAGVTIDDIAAYFLLMRWFTPRGK